jgi:hypothetical protein
MRFSSVSASELLRFAVHCHQLLQIAVTPQEEEEPLDQLIRKRIHIRATEGRFASPMSSALKMHAEACEQQPSYASRANVKVPELNVYFVFVSPLTVVHV